MKTELNDESLTAYALGEMDAAEMKAMEILLAEAARTGNHAPRETLEEIRATVSLSQGAFAAEADDHSMSMDQRDRVESLAREAATRPAPLLRHWRALAATTALLIGAAVVLPALGRAKEASGSVPEVYSELARSPKPATPLELSGGEALRYQAGKKVPPADVEGPKKAEGKSGRDERPMRQPEVAAEVYPPRVGFIVEGSGAPAPTGRSNDQAVGQVANEVLFSDPTATASPSASVLAGGTVALRVDSLPGTSGASTSNVPFLKEENEKLEALGYIEQSQRFRTSAVNAPQSVDHAWRGYRPLSAEPPSAEAYQRIVDSGFVRVVDQPLSTFSIDVDTASYANVRRFLEQRQLPPPDAVRVEELINYFDYSYPAPRDGAPFAAHFEAAACPWAPGHTLVRIGLKGREVPRAERPATNLVFLIDVSGSMQPENKLPLVKRAMAMLTRQLDERDRVSIVTYASGVNLALPVTNASRQDAILGAIENLGAGGSTNGAGGIQLAYQSARENFLPGGVNRVILATDGDFNVGISDNDSLVALIQQEAKSGVFLSIFGFGMGNLKDDKLEMLADKGNGVYGYIDSESEARKVFVEKLSGTLVTIAKDVKIQVEFNPSRVAAYRLVGYENRALAAKDFNDDRKDAGEIGAGHTVTALYEVVPAGQAIPAAGGGSELRYQPTPSGLSIVAEPVNPSAHVNELLLVKLRYKDPEGAQSKLLEFPLQDDVATSLSADLKFASAVAAFGKLLRGNALGPALNYDGMMQLAQAGLAASDDPRRAEFVHLMLQARPLIEGYRANEPGVN